MKRAPLQRRKPIPHRNAARREAAYRRQFAGPVSGLDYAAWVREQPCLVCGSTPSQAAHLFRSRGAGGTWRDIAPLCWRCHREQHAVGIETFLERHGTGPLYAAAEVLPRLWATVHGIDLATTEEHA